MNEMIVVQCDFDDTITVGNVSTAIREMFGPDSWTSMEEEYLSGKYSVEESNIRQFALVKAARQEIVDFVLGDVVIRYGFEEFVGHCRGEGIRLVVVSGGLDLYINPVMAHLGYEDLEVFSAVTHFTADGIRVEYTDPWGNSVIQGFKEAFVRHLKRNGDTVIYIGDGLSDVTPAAEADYVIARSSLQRYLSGKGIPFVGFETFNDVGRHVQEIRERIGG